MDTKVFLLIIAINSVLSNREVDKLCVRNGLDAMYVEAKGTSDVRNDTVLLESAQRTFKLGIDLIHRRAQNTKLDCFYDFIKKYKNALKKITEEWDQRLAKASSPKERSDAVVVIAAMSQVMRCDEEGRLQQSNDHVQCTRKEEMGTVDTKFNALYNVLRGRMYLGNIWETNKNKVVEGIINYDLQVYSKMYGDAKNCVSRQRKVDRCPNLKVLADELERFFSLFQLIDISKG